MKMKFDRFCKIEFAILSVNCSHVCFIYVKIYEKISSGGLEVSLSIEETKQAILDNYKSENLREAGIGTMIDKV